MSLTFYIQELLQGNEFARWGQSRGGWGGAKLVERGKLTGKTRIPLMNIPAPTIGRIPRVQNVTLIANPTFFAGAFAGILRWEIRAGVGTASSTIICDAARLQQVSLSAESLDVSLFLDDYGTLDVADATNLQVAAAAYTSDGNTSTSAAQYTIPWHVPHGGNISFAIPEGAASWMIQGIAADVNRATLVYSVIQSSGLVVDKFTGAQLLAAHASGAFIPLQGGTQSINVQNNEVVDDIDGSILFQLDI